MELDDVARGERHREVLDQDPVLPLGVDWVRLLVHIPADDLKRARRDGAQQDLCQAFGARRVGYLDPRAVLAGARRVTPAEDHAEDDPVEDGRRRVVVDSCRKLCLAIGLHYS
jgi:hypothetical protein